MIYKSSHRQIVLILLAVIGLIGLVYIPYLGETAFVHEEPRRALIARNMVLNNDFLVPRLQDSAYLSKPPLYNWMIAASGSLFGGIDEFSARITSVLALFCLVTAMIFLSHKYLSREALAFLAVGLVLTPEIANKARLAEIELVFTLFVTLSLWLWFYSYEAGERGFKLWLIPSCMVGLAFLSKREPAILFYYLGVGGYLFYQGNFKLLFSWKQIISSLTILGSASVWFLPLIQEVGLEGIIQNSQKEVIHRELGGSLFEYLANVVTYPLEIWIALLPFSFLIFYIFFKPVRLKVIGQHKNLFAFCCIVLLVNLPVYLIRGNIAVRYFLPMFPTALVFLSLLFQAAVQVESGQRQTFKKVYWLQRGLYVLTMLLLIVFMLRALPALPLPMLPLPVLQSDHLIPVLEQTPLLIILTTLLLTVGYFSYQYWSEFTWGLLIACFFFATMVQIFYFTVQLPRQIYKTATQRDVQALVQAVNQYVPETKLPLQSMGDVPFDIWYYLPPNTMIAEPEYIEESRPYFISFRHDVEELELSYKALYELPYRGKWLVLGSINHIE